MKRLLLIGFAACTFALAPTLPASAVPGVHPSALTRTDNSIIRVSGGRGHHYGWYRGHHHGWYRGHRYGRYRSPYYGWGRGPYYGYGGGPYYRYGPSTSYRCMTCRWDDD